MSELWLAIPGFLGYEVSDRGRVRSHKRGAPRLLSIQNDRGYSRTTLQVDGRGLHRRVHQLVALAFIGPRPDGMEVRHIDGDRSNNTPANLEYGTSAENRADALEHGTHNMARKTHCLRGHEFTTANTARIILQTGGSARRCKTCAADATARHRARQRVGATA